MDIGIIGGADGPTAVFIASDFSWYDFVIIAIVCIVVVGFIRMIRRKIGKQ